jgi:hypothetical protein
MRWVREPIEADVRPTTSGQSDLMAFIWRGSRYVVATRIGLSRSRSPGLVFQRVATDSGLVFMVHAERGGQWVLDAVPDLLAPA